MVREIDLVGKAYDVRAAGRCSTGDNGRDKAICKEGHRRIGKVKEADLLEGVLPAGNVEIAGIASSNGLEGTARVEQCQDSEHGGRDAS